MKFNLEVTTETESPISESLPVPVTIDLKKDAQRIKKSSDRNRKIFNDLSRQFLHQLVEKFDAGEFDETA